MTDKKTTRRAVSKPRLYKAVKAEMAEYNLTADNTIGELIAAVEKSIVQEATAE